MPEGEDWRVLVAAGQLLARDLCDLTILGERSRVLALAKKYHTDISRAEILDVRLMSAAEKEQLVQTLVELRGSKGMTRAKAQDVIEQDANFLGTLIMFQRRADGMVSGACHTTADTMRPALQIIKTEPGASLVSSVFFMLLPERVYVFGDCAINVDPSAADLAQIAASSAATARSKPPTPNSRNPKHSEPRDAQILRHRPQSGDVVVRNRALQLGPHCRQGASCLALGASRHCVRVEG